MLKKLLGKKNENKQTNKGLKRLYLQKTKQLKLQLVDVNVHHTILHIMEINNSLKEFPQHFTTKREKGVHYFWVNFKQIGA